MKNILTIILISIVLGTACQSKNSTNFSSDDSLSKSNSPKVGADVDPSGCKGSAGYQFSIVKNRCVRVWEEGIRFEAVDPDTASGQPTVIYLIVSDDKKKAEVVFGGTDKPVMLDLQKIEEGETQPVYYANKTEGVEVEYAKHLYWINYNGKPVYSITVSDIDKFEKLL